MYRETLQEQFTRLIWWVMFVGVGISVFSYGVLNPPKQFLESGLFRVLLVLVGITSCQLLFWHKPLFGAGTVLLTIVLSASFLITSGVFNNSFAVLSIVTLPTLFISVLWGWRGGLLALLASIPVIFTKPNSNIEATVIGWVILIGTAFSGALIHRLVADVDQARAKLEKMASSDPLTKLGNRFALQADFIRLKGRGLMCMWDVNGLKKVNDEKGHHAGDTYLLAFVKAYQSQCFDDLYRIGGDEFVSFHDSQTNLSDVYANVRQKFSDVSAGWAAIEQRDLDTVLRQADRAMYLEKGKRIASTNIG